MIHSLHHNAKAPIKKATLKETTETLRHGNTDFYSVIPASVVSCSLSTRDGDLTSAAFRLIWFR